MISPSPSALDGIRVLDLSRILAGPSATQLLGDLGADVVKVEKPGEGDDTRRWGPPYVEGVDGPTEESAYYLCANRNKRSIAIDLANAEGQRMVHQLLKKADVLVENYKVGGLAAYGLSYEQLQQKYPRLIYCSITGFGQTGPYARRPGYDFLIQGMGGIMSLTGAPDGEPMKVGVGIADLMTGMYAVTGILAALHYRERTGRGQHIDASLLDTQISWLANAGTNYLMNRELQPRLGNSHPNIVPYQVFATSDFPIILAIGNDAQFARFCAIADAQHLSRDERYATNVERVRNRADLVPQIANIMLGRPRDSWLAALGEATIPCGPVNNIEQVFSDEHVQARGAEVTLPCAWAADGKVKVIANPLRFSETPPRYDRAPPRLNEQREEILTEWLSESEMQSCMN